MFNIMICNITKICIRLSICTSSEVVLSSMCRLNRVVVSFSNGAIFFCMKTNQHPLHNPPQPTTKYKDISKRDHLMCSRCVHYNYMSVGRAFKYYTGNSFNQAPASARRNAILEKYLKSLTHCPSMPRLRGSMNEFVVNVTSLLV